MCAPCRSWDEWNDQLHQSWMGSGKQDSIGQELLSAPGGLDSFSMSASSGLTVKKIIRNSSYADAQKFRDLILQQDTPEDVIAKLV